MVYKVFALKKEKLTDANKVLADDTVSRQSILMRDAKALSMEGDEQFIIIEGSDDAVARAQELFKELSIEPTPKAEDVYKKVKAEEDDAANAMGMIFG